MFVTVLVIVLHCHVLEPELPPASECPKIGSTRLGDENLIYLGKRRDWARVYILRGWRYLGDRASHGTRSRDCADFQGGLELRGRI